MQTTYTDHMNRHWTQTLGLASSKALIEGWRQLEQAAKRLNSGSSHWQVLQLPTGSGKTEALKVLCSTQDLIRHPGVLIVTKFRTEADKLATGINKLAGAQVARSVHQEATGSDDELGFSPVLVTTHAAYRIALKQIADTGQSRKADRLLAYNCGRRSWVIVDEAFDWADTYSLNASNLRSMSGDLTRAMQEELRVYAEKLYEFSHRITDIGQNGRSDQTLATQCFDMLTQIDLDKLIAEVRATSDDVLAKWIENRPAKEDEPAIRIERPSKDQYLEQLAQLRTIVRIGHGWISGRSGRTQLHSSRSLIGVDGMRGIILDATAGIDPTYSIMPDRMRLLPRPMGIRNYRNVNLHVSYGHKVGKEHLAQNAGKEWAIVWGDLSKRLAGKRVLVCAHKDACEAIEPYGPKDGSVRIAYWGNLDGRNDWDTCEAAILFGLPYLDDIEPAQRFIAYQGQQFDAWFAGNRKFEGHADIRNALGDGFIARSVVQAINRIRCRRSNDADGNCASTDIYLLLPKGNTGKAVVCAIQNQMPGIQVVDWHTGATKRKARKVPTEAKITDYFTNAEPGQYRKTDLATTLRINPSSLERMTAKLRDCRSALTQKLTSLAVSYHFQTGRGREAYFVKR